MFDWFEEKIYPKYSELDENMALKPFYLLNFLQDLASNNAEELGFGYSYIYPKNYAWFLLKYRMEFSNYPFGTDEIVLKTQPRGYNKLFAYRNFKLYKNNICIGNVSSMWAVVDINSRKMVPVEDIIFDTVYMSKFDKNEDDLDFARVKALDCYSKTEDFYVRYNDIDLNGHANNGNYIVWAFEPINLDFRKNHKLKTLDIVFKREAMCGDKVISNVYINNNKTYHSVVNSNGEELCLIECLWDCLK